MNTVAVVLLVVAGLAFVAALIYAMVRTRFRAPFQQAPVVGPMYKPDDRPVQYYRPAPSPQGSEPPKVAKPQSSDPRNAPLPRCPKCDTAIAHEEKRCPKCGFALRPL